MPAIHLGAKDGRVGLRTSQGARDAILVCASAEQVATTKDETGARKLWSWSRSQCPRSLLSVEDAGAEPIANAESWIQVCSMFPRHHSEDASGTRNDLNLRPRDGRTPRCPCSEVCCCFQPVSQSSPSSTILAVQGSPRPNTT